MRRKSASSAVRVQRIGGFDDVLWTCDVDTVAPGPLRGVALSGAQPLPWYGAPNELTPTEKGALLALAFERGGCFTVEELAAQFGMTVNGAQRVLRNLSRVIPIAESDGYWYKVDDADAERMTGAEAQRGRKAQNAE